MALESQLTIAPDLTDLHITRSGPRSMPCSRRTRYARERLLPVSDVRTVACAVCRPGRLRQLRVSRQVSSLGQAPLGGGPGHGPELSFNSVHSSVLCVCGEGGRCSRHHWVITARTAGQRRHAALSQQASGRARPQYRRRGGPFWRRPTGGRAAALGRGSGGRVGAGQPAA